MTKKRTSNNFTRPIFVAFILGSFLLTLTQLPRLTGVTNTTEASANTPRRFVAAQSPVFCPQVMHLCPDGNEVPLLPENRCQPSCRIISPSFSPSALPSPQVSSCKPRPTQNPTIVPKPTRFPFPSASAICNPRYIPNMACLGGMPLEIDPVTCTYRCRDYRELSQ